MTAVSCPLCELRFASRNERDWHLREEHGSHRTHPPVRAADPVAEFRRRHPAGGPAPEEGP